MAAKEKIHPVPPIITPLLVIPLPKSSSAAPRPRAPQPQAPAIAPAQPDASNCDASSWLKARDYLVPKLSVLITQPPGL